MFTKEQLVQLYQNDKLSMQQIATQMECSLNQVVYWMHRHNIERRSISDAIYQQHNPTGDPFTLQPITTTSEAQLFGLGIGLYWGEGNKLNKYAVRLGNTNPVLLNTFIKFLETVFVIDKERLKFGLQIFTDIDPAEAMAYWTNVLNVKESQFYKITVTISGSIGTYRKKSKYGVVTVYYHNKKLRDILVGMLPK